VDELKKLVETADKAKQTLTTKQSELEEAKSAFLNALEDVINECNALMDLDE
jgi:hypothetical protein